jgi:RsiW-degrading membrane proteinase PrsW (M82 family)
MSLFIIVIAFILIAAALVWFMLRKDKGEKEPTTALWIAAGFGFGGSILAAIIEHFTVSTNLLNGSSTDLKAVFIATLTVGVIEEVCKFIPLAIFIDTKKYFNEHTDGIIYFAIAGLAFGVPENILYSLQFGAKVGLSRLVLTPIFHAATTAMVGYFLARSKIDKKSLLIPALALVGAILLHSLYDFGLASQTIFWTILSLMITAGMTAIFFILFMRSNELDREEGLSVVGNIDFCRNCGQPNPTHALYCEHCGKRA